DSQVNNQPVQNTKTPVEETKVTFQDSLIRHTVLEHETLYAISKRFMVSIDTLVKVNNIKKNSIQPGDVLIIPLKKPTFEHVQVREIPSTNPLINNSGIQFTKKDSYKILVLLPMNYASSQSAISGMDQNSSLNKYTKVAIDFYMGIKLALDSLQKLGLNADVQLIDTRVDSNAVLNYLKTCGNDKPDLIIGPLMPNLLKVTARWCKENKVPLLSPVASNSALLKDNPYFFSSVPSDLRLLEGMADDLALNHSQHNLILVTSGIAGDLKNYDLIRTRINSQLKSNAIRSKLKEVSYRGELNAAIINDTVNIFIFPSENRVAVSYFMTAMNKIKNTKGERVNITVYGLKEWENFEELKINYKQKLNLHYPSSINLNYSDSTVNVLIQQFRKKYKTDPGKFGIQGFDISYYFISNYLMQLNSPTPSVMNDFHFTSRGAGNGSENNNVFIMRYNGFDIEESSRVHE
ncbi:MAG: LysM peptidoglycan-binding domain-containing protein, partial [Crocinitomicaceae bacterium]